MANRKITLNEEQKQQFFSDAAALLAPFITMGHSYPEQDLLHTIEQAAQEVQEPIEREYSSRIIPGSADFDFSEYMNAIKEAGGLDALFEEASNRSYNDAINTNIAGLRELGAAMAKAAEYATENAKSISSGLSDITETAKKALTGINAIVNSDWFKTLKEATLSVNTFIQENSEFFAALAKGAAELESLVPYIQMELDGSPKYGGMTIEDVLECIGTDGTAGNIVVEGILEKAKQRQAEYDAAANTVAEIEQAAEELPRIIANPTENINFPLDKPNSVIWNLLASAEKNGQMRLNINTSKKGSKQDALILYSISFDELETGVSITKRLTAFDKLCYIAAGAIWNAGNEITTPTQIYYVMGNSKKPSAEDIRKINDSLTKMGIGRIYVDNEQEIKTAKGYAHFRYDGQLLPFERVNAYINGQLTDSAIHFFREPPLISFARERKQITTFSRKLLESPISKTDANLRLQDYLLEQIGHMKDPKNPRNNVILLETIYKKCEITSTKQKQRAPEKIEKFLAHFKKCEWIKDYKLSADKVEIFFPKTTGETPQKK